MKALEWLQDRLFLWRSVKACISGTFSPSEIVGLLIVLICCVSLVGLGCYNTILYRRRYSTKVKVEKQQ